MEEAILEILRKGNDVHEFTSEIAEMMTAFIEWIGNNEFYRTGGKDGAWIFQSEPYIIWKSTDELYEYWRLEIAKTKEDENSKM